jgi:hypothetical protein
MKTPSFLLLVGCLMLAALPAGAQRPGLGPQETLTDPVDAPTSPLTARVSLPPILPKEPGTPRLQAALDRLAKASVARTSLALEELALQEQIPLDQGRALVVVEGDTDRLPAGLEELGGEIDAVGDGFAALFAPVSALPAMAALDGVEYIRPPLPGYPLQEAIPEYYGTAVSEGVKILGAWDWHEVEYQGEGIKAAVIDSGFYDWTGLQANGDLPQNTICINDWSSQDDCGDSDSNQWHGSACVQYLHDMAPGLDALYLYPFQYTEQLPFIVEDMISKGIDVASLSWGWLNGEPNDGSGFVSKTVNMAKEDGDIFFAVAAGNHRLKHWEGTFSDSPDDADPCHDFDPGLAEPTHFLSMLNYARGNEGDVLNQTSGRLTAALTWNGWPTTDQDYDLYLYELVDGVWEIADSSTDTQDGDDPPTELIHHANLASGYYALAICSKGKIRPTGYLELFTWRNHQDYRYRMEASSLLEPATADGAMTAGAFPWELPDTLEDFSSLGPRNPDNGGPYRAEACDRPKPECKPDFAGPDLTQFDVDGDTWRLIGTSAAAPHLAGAAALVMGAYEYGADETYEHLRDAALEQPDPLPSPLAQSLSLTMNKGWGWGRLWLGEHPGIPTAIDVTAFQARVVDAGIQLEWETASEVGLLGFDIHRSDQPEGEYTPINSDLIPAQAGGGTLGATYTWLDSSVAPDTTFYYQLEIQDLSGGSTFHGPVSAQVVRTAPYPLMLPLVRSD